jgi:hypothetical protein
MSPHGPVTDPADSPPWHQKGAKCHALGLVTNLWQGQVIRSCRVCRDGHYVCVCACVRACVCPRKDNSLLRAVRALGEFYLFSW